MQWARYAIDVPAGQGLAVADIDGDGCVDIVINGMWLRNTGGSDITWAAHRYPSSWTWPHTAIALHDLNHDGRVDKVLAPAELAGTRYRTSWFDDFSASDWPIETISSVSQDEALTAADIDRDDLIDLLLGTVWLRNEPDGGWRPFQIDSVRRNPDRNSLADIDGDGQLDAVVGFEAISKPGDIVWYEQGSDPTSAWQPHLIGRVTGPMSVGVGDTDGDGDQDVVVGEHDLGRPARARLFVFENVDGKGPVWREHVVHRDDEHHDGALLVDLDGDGDLDIVSIGWGHGKVVWYENLQPSHARQSMIRAGECSSR